ncbi:RNA ligase RtcB family protein [Clostridium scatologenes]|uniref:3'-phosphate/5'-hydroxy nucleic acid ligase n=1 Tax=Clostridium scatologenes TaxID=1548 RepID=A0A0E3JYV9_CLOSL|nr:RNA ligase RtcB family protein [Clostridium scatologenes]AKA69318.1 release factor H-coupled RctB family protein [Clostridium scatologenes]
MYKIIYTEKSWMESEGVEQVKKLSKLKGVILVVGYPDLHPGKTPVGAAFLTEGIIYPHLIGNDIGCSVSLFQTSIFEKKFKVDKAMKSLNNLEFEKDEFNIGTIGKGNHFAEFTAIDEILDKEEFNNLNLDKNKVHLLIHSGSRGLGEHILRKHIEKYSCQNGLVEGSEGFESYLKDYEKAILFARKSRKLIAERLCDAISGSLETLVIEAIHNGIEFKDNYYVHRKGAAPSDNGYVVIAGSRGTNSYIVKPINESSDTGFSIAHGAGRKWQRNGCKERLLGKFSKKDVKNGNFSYNIVCRDKSLIYEEAPEAYKNIDRVIQDLIEFDLIKVIAKLKPIITYKD